MMVTHMPNWAAIYQGREIDALRYVLTRDETGETLVLDQGATSDELDAAIAAFWPPPAPTGLVAVSAAWLRARLPRKRLTASH